MDKRVAVLVDAENVPARQWPVVSALCSAVGRVAAVKLFGDFSEGRLAEWLGLARQHGLTPVLQLSGGKGKNTADIALAIAAMDLLHGGAVDAFCIASSDRDLLPLVCRLVEAGKDVHVVAQQADDRLATLASSVKVWGEVAPSPARRLLTAYRKVNADGAPMALSELAKLMRTLEPEMLPKGKAKARLRESGLFELTDRDGACLVSLKRGAAA